MPALELTNEQGTGLVRQLPPDRKRVALLSLAEEATGSNFLQELGEP